MPLYTTVGLALTEGAALWTSGARVLLAKASASAVVSEMGGEMLVTEEPPKLKPGSTSRTLVPSASMLACTAFCEPLPTAISTITDATPMVNPRIVSPERSLFAKIPVNAIRTVSTPIRRSPLVLVPHQERRAASAPRR